jgi:hypothetical protein
MAYIILTAFGTSSIRNNLFQKDITHVYGLVQPPKFNLLLQVRICHLAEPIHQASSEHQSLDILLCAEFKFLIQKISPPHLQSNMRFHARSLARKAKRKNVQHHDWDR